MRPTYKFNCHYPFFSCILGSLEPPDVTGSSLTLGTAGSRRTVYLVDENPKISDPSQTSDPNVSATNNNAQPDPAQQPSTLLMYNRISNVIGTIGSEASSSMANSALPNQDTAISSTDKNLKDKKKNEERENAVWYEYGCV